MKIILEILLLLYITGFVYYIDIFWHEGYPFQKYDVLCIILLLISLGWPLYLLAKWLDNKIIK